MSSSKLVFSLCSRALTHFPPTFYIGAKQNPKWRPGQTGQETHRLGSARRADSTANSANAMKLGMESEGGILPTGAPGQAAGAENFWERCRRTERERRTKKGLGTKSFSKKKLSGKKGLGTKSFSKNNFPDNYGVGRLFVCLNKCEVTSTN